MGLNIFINPYKENNENSLTYYFLSLLEHLNNKSFIGWLVDMKDMKANKKKIITDIKSQTGGEGGNPDGYFEIELEDNNFIKIFLENKTTSPLDTDQLKRHLNRGDFKKNDKLLVITPRQNDGEIIKGMKKKQIIFKNWNEISERLSKLKHPLAENFIEYVNKIYEIEGLGELTSTDIQNYINAIKEKNKNKIKKIENHFFYQMSLIFKGFIAKNKSKRSVYSKLSPEFKAPPEIREYIGKTKFESMGNYWNMPKRIGIEMNWDTPGKYGQWFALSLYYEEHQDIKLKNNIPEIAFFFDYSWQAEQIKGAVENLRNDIKFKNIVDNLVQKGFENYLDNVSLKLNNAKEKDMFCLLIYRKPITEFTSINIDELGKFADKVFEILEEANAKEHPFFKSFK